MKRQKWINNCEYNLMKQLSKILQFLWYIGNYLGDAKKAGA